jgi:hypothetical protein
VGLEGREASTSVNTKGEDSLTIFDINFFFLACVLIIRMFDMPSHMLVSIRLVAAKKLKSIAASRIRTHISSMSIPSCITIAKGL